MFLFWGRVVEAADPGEKLRPPPPQKPSPAPPGSPSCVSRPERINNSSREFWVCPGVYWSASLTTLADLFWGGGTAVLHQAPPKRQSLLTYLQGWPTKEAHFSCSDPWSRYLGHVPNLMTKGEGGTPMAPTTWLSRLLEVYILISELHIDILYSTLFVSAPSSRQQTGATLSQLQASWSDETSSAVMMKFRFFFL